jgi:hypothetical protein
MKDLGDLNYFLGVQAIRTSFTLHFRQSKYILDLLLRSKMLGAKPYSSPCVSGSQISAHSSDLSPQDTMVFHQTVGALQYCMITHHDISFAVNQLCQHMHRPTTTHWTAAKHILYYLKGSVVAFSPMTKISNFGFEN